MELILREYPLEYLPAFSSDPVIVGKIICMAHEDRLRCYHDVVSKVLKSMNKSDLKLVLEQMFDTRNMFERDRYEFLRTRETFLPVRDMLWYPNGRHAKEGIYDAKATIKEISDCLVDIGHFYLSLYLDFRRNVFINIHTETTSSDEAKTKAFECHRKLRYLTPMLSLFRMETIITMVGRAFHLTEIYEMVASTYHIDKNESSEKRLLSHPTYVNGWIEWAEKKLGCLFGDRMTSAFIADGLNRNVAFHYEKEFEERNCSEFVSSTIDMHSCGKNKRRNEKEEVTVMCFELNAEYFQDTKKIRDFLPVGIDKRECLNFFQRISDVFGSRLKIPGLNQCTYPIYEPLGNEGNDSLRTSFSRRLLCNRITFNGSEQTGRIGPPKDCDGFANVFHEDCVWYDFGLNRTFKGMDRCATAVSAIIRDDANGEDEGSLSAPPVHYNDPYGMDIAEVVGHDIRGISDFVGYGTYGIADVVGYVFLYWLYIKGFPIDLTTLGPVRCLGTFSTDAGRMDGSRQVSSFYGPFFVSRSEEYVETNYFMDGETGIGWKQTRYFSLGDHLQYDVYDLHKIGVSRHWSVMVREEDTIPDVEPFVMLKKARMIGEGYSKAVPKVLLNHSVSWFCGENNVGGIYEREEGEESMEVDTNEEEFADRFFPFGMARWLMVKVNPAEEFSWRTKSETRKTWPPRRGLDWESMDKRPDETHPWKNVPLLCINLKSCKIKKRYVQERLLPHVVGPVKVGISERDLRRILEARISVLLSLLDAKTEDGDYETEDDVESILRTWKNTEENPFPNTLHPAWNTKTYATEDSQLENFVRYALSEQNMANLMSTRCESTSKEGGIVWWDERRLKDLIKRILEDGVNVLGYEKTLSRWYYYDCAPLFHFFRETSS